MTKYAISVNDILFYVFSLGALPENTDNIRKEIPDGAYALIIYPSELADMAVFACDSRMQELKEPRLIFEALSLFLGEVRGLPLPDIEVEFLKRRYTVPIFQHK